MSIRTLVGAGLIAMGASQALAGDAALMPRVRTDEPSIRRLLDEALEFSATFRRLVDAIDHTNGIVYIEGRECHHRVRACLQMSVTISGPHRVLHILVDPRQTDGELVIALGHELQHANELLAERGVTSAAAAYSFYERTCGSVAARGRLEFETETAVKMGLVVGEEIARSRVPR